MSDAAEALPQALPRRRPAAPVPKDRILTRIDVVRELGRNAIAVWGERAYRVRTIYDRNWLQDFLLVNDPDAIKHVLLDNVQNYVKSRQVQRTTGPALGNGLFNADGESWRFQRRTTAPMFSARHVTDFAPAMHEIAQQHAENWREGQTFDAAQAMMRLTYDIIKRTMFSDDVEVDYAAMSQHFATYLDTLGRVDLLTTMGLPHWVPTPKRLRGGASVRFFRRAAGALIAKRQAEIARDSSAAPNDLLTLLLTTRDPEDGRLFGQEEVYNNIMTFVFAGHETTANALAWTLYLLSEFPEADARVAEEVRDANGDISKLVYTRMVLEEAMRLYPPAPLISRDSIGPDTVGPHAIRANTSVLISPWIVHRHRELWQAPDDFDPERFAPAAREKLHRFQYIPFGAGPRICIGMGFAMQEALIVLSQVLGRWRFSLVPGHPVVPFARLTLRPQHGLQMTLSRRA